MNSNGVVLFYDDNARNNGSLKFYIYDSNLYDHLGSLKELNNSQVTQPFFYIKLFDKRMNDSFCIKCMMGGPIGPGGVR